MPTSRVINRVFDPCIWILAVLATCVLSVPATAYESIHEDLTLVWSDGSGDCHEVSLTLAADHVWSCPVIIPTAGSIWFQVWTGDRNSPKYGADIDNPEGLILAEDPPLVPIYLAMPGCFRYTFLESDPSFEFEGAAGSMLATIQYRDDPVAPVSGTRVDVTDSVTAGYIGCFVLASGESMLNIGNLEPGRTYDLVFAADGYQQALRTEFLADTVPLAFTVVLEVLVDNRDSSWGSVKTLFR